MTPNHVDLLQIATLQQHLLQREVEYTGGRNIKKTQKISDLDHGWQRLSWCWSGESSGQNEVPVAPGCGFIQRCPELRPDSFKGQSEHSRCLSDALQQQIKDSDGIPSPSELDCLISREILQAVKVHSRCIRDLLPVGIPGYSKCWQNTLWIPFNIFSLESTWKVLTMSKTFEPLNRPKCFGIDFEYLIHKFTKNCHSISILNLSASSVFSFIIATVL